MSNPLLLLIIAGPTSAGKTRLALHLAQLLNTGIISADSRQIYRYMDIGTGKPTPEEQKIVPHYMLNIIDPDQSYSAGEYGRNAREIIERQSENGHIPLLVGGTGLYIRAVIDGLSPSLPGDPHIKAEILKKMKARGIHPLYEELLSIDPHTAERLHPNDRQRIARALEVFYTTGKRLSECHKDRPVPLPCTLLFFCIYRSRSVLYTMINKSVEKMFEKGVVEETALLLERGYRPECPGMQSIGYCHICNYIQGRIPLTDAKELMKRDTRRYAKRQMTWFRNEKRALWFECPEHEDVLNVTPQILSALMKTKEQNG